MYKNCVFIHFVTILLSILLVVIISSTSQYYLLSVGFLLVCSASTASSFNRHGNNLHLTGLDHSTIAAVDTFGTVRIIEVGLASILR